MDRCKESLILFDHGCFIHDDALELAVLQDFCSSLANCSHNYRLILDDLALESLLVLQKSFKLPSSELFYSLNIESKEVFVLRVNFKLLFLNVVIYILAITKLVNHTDFNKC